VRLTTHWGFLKNRGREVRGSPEPANRQRIPAVALFTATGKGLNPRSSRHWGGEDVHQRPKGVNALLFGCSERAGRWRGGLPLGARLGGNGGLALGRLDLKLRERRMWRGCVGASSARGRGGGGLDGVRREGSEVPHERRCTAEGLGWRHVPGAQRRWTGRTHGARQGKERG
jgi:hypothetical protein